MTNLELRQEIEKSRFKKYEIARQLGITESSFSRLLRDELILDQVTRIRNAISELRAERDGEAQ